MNLLSRRQALLLSGAGIAGAITGCPNVSLEIDENRFGSELEKFLFIKERIEFAREALRIEDGIFAISKKGKVENVSRQDYNVIDSNGQAIKTAVWYPESKNAKCPVVLFSHGYTCSAEGSLYLTEGLARRGYVVVAPDHNDAFSFDRIGLLDDIFASYDLAGNITKKIANLAGFAESDEFNNFLRGILSGADESLIFNKRLSEINRILEFTKNELPYCNPKVGQIIDLENMAFGGHSAGAWTAMKLGALNRQFKGLFMLSPACQEFSEQELWNIETPCIYFTGDLDSLREQTLRAYDLTQAPKKLYQIRNGGHLAFLDRAFLYGVGIPFLNMGEVVFTSEIEEKSINAYEALRNIAALGSHYAEQLEGYPAKAIGVASYVGDFLDEVFAE